MTRAHTLDAATGAAPARMAPLQRLGGALAAAYALASVWAERSRSRHELARLLRHHDSYLRDTGIGRDQILMEVSKPFWRP